MKLLLRYKLESMKKAALLLFAFSLTMAHAQQAATVMDSNSMKVRVEAVTLYQGQGIPFLQWKRSIYLVENTAFVNYANITGRFKEKVLTATLNGRLLSVSEDGSFVVRLEFSGEEKSFIIAATDSQNKVHRMQYKITQAVPGATATYAKIKPFRWRFSAGAGYTIISYRQQDITTYEQKVITVKAGVIYRAIPEKLDLGVNGFFNVLPLTSTSIDGYQIQYLGVNVRAGYHVIKAPNPFRFIFNFGFYFNNSYGNVGFADMYGPQISPEFMYVFDNGNSLFSYVKYAHSLSGSQGVSLKNNREVATGLHYSFPVSTSNRLSIGVDLSQLSLSLADAWASTNTYSLSAGISF
jgi:hypothetical protein